MTSRFSRWMVGLASIACGCGVSTRPAAVQIPAPVAVQPPAEHFVPAPRIEPPRIPTKAENEGRECNTSISGAIGQVITPTASGIISEMDLGICQNYRNSQEPPAAGKLLVELRTTEAGKPANDAAIPLFRGTVPVASLPVGGGLGEMIRLDLKPFKVAIAKDVQVAVVVTALDFDSSQHMSPIGGQAVNGNSYPGGLLYRFERHGWRPDMFPLQLQFRMFGVQDDMPGISATQTATGEPPEIRVIHGAFRSPGTIVAQCMPKPQQNSTYVYHRPIPAGKWEFRSAVFQDAGAWYLEFTTFNGTNGQGAMQRRGPRSITLTRAGENGGRIVYPLKEYVDSNDFTGMMPAPGSGSVRQYTLQDSSKPLLPGSYVVSIVMPTDISEEVLTAEFTVPQNSK